MSTDMTTIIDDAIKTTQSENARLLQEAMDASKDILSALDTLREKSAYKALWCINAHAIAKPKVKKCGASLKIITNIPFLSSMKEGAAVRNTVIEVDARDPNNMFYIKEDKFKRYKHNTTQRFPNTPDGKKAVIELLANRAHDKKLVP